MRKQIEKMLSELEAGRITRRQFVGHLAAVMTLVAGGSKMMANDEQAPERSTLAAQELNHIALRVTDLDRSQKFYEDHLGLTLSSGSSGSRFMNCGPHFLALFKAASPGLDHFSFTLEDYQQKSVAEKLLSKNLQPELESNRTYFYDPDGIRLQVSGRNR